MVFGVPYNKTEPFYCWQWLSKNSDSKYAIYRISLQYSWRFAINVINCVQERFLSLEKFKRDAGFGCPPNHTLC